MYDGVIRGLDTIYRRSVATGKLDSSNVRHLDAIVGFTGLKVGIERFIESSVTLRRSIKL